MNVKAIMVIVRGVGYVSLIMKGNELPQIEGCFVDWQSFGISTTKHKCRQKYQRTSGILIKWSVLYLGMLLNYINGNFAIFLGAIYYGLIAPTL